MFWEKVARIVHISCLPGHQTQDKPQPLLVSIIDLFTNIIHMSGVTFAGMSLWHGSLVHHVMRFHADTFAPAIDTALLSLRLMQS